MRIEPRPQAAFTENLVKVGSVVFETRAQTDKQKDIQTR